MSKYVKIPTSLFYSKLWKEPRQFSEMEAYVDLCRRVAYRKESVNIHGKPYTIQPGQFLCSASNLSKEWNQPRESVIDYLDSLEKLGAIRREYINSVTIVTLDLDFDFPSGKIS